MSPTATAVASGQAAVLRRATAFLLFIALGMPGALLGVAWPAMHLEFGVSLDQLGLLLLAGTVGFTLLSFLSGRLAERLSLGRILVAASGAALLAILGYGLSRSWALLLLAGFVSGMAAGLIDSVLNIFVAEHESSRIANWLHASFGIGAALGPLVGTLMIALERSWRDGYLALAVIQLLVFGALALTQAAWGSLPAPENAPETREKATANSFRRPAVWLGIGLFFIYTSIEVTVGQWAFVFLTQARGVGAVVAGTWTSAFWAFLTGGRVLFGFLSGRVGSFVLLRLAFGGVLMGTLLLLVRAAPGINMAGLALLGATMAPIFPLLVAVTPERLGGRAATRVMGVQVGAAGLGGAAGPGAVGLLVVRSGAGVIGVALAAGAALQILVYGLVRWSDRRPAGPNRDVK